ncbi:putative nucleic acid-binding protein [Silvibacterium bohemicum]|uniref:Putative nucleic acid-binding protein n=1 Tax=Silvibacterium bohemicum TaxID=1577686 RepID=A0A841JL96_9BACT|nr:PIN domain-containing protein [Silvibacterium bohemicum]MBB6142122.1 putative nucleic acid-binding protein [Silvibacterium bohemicum]
MSRIYWDAMVFIYLIEDHPVFAPKVEHIYKRMLERQDTLCTSAFTVGEALIGPMKGKDTELIAKMRALFQSSEVTLLSFDPGIAEMYADLRANCAVKAPDAIHLATAAHARVDLFLTNDKHLQRLTIPGIAFIAGLDGSVF